MITKVQRWGNSQGIRLSKELFSHVDTPVGDEVPVPVEAGALTVRAANPRRGRHDLSVLLPAGGDDHQVGEYDWGARGPREEW